jgi:hypothetical protein
MVATVGAALACVAAGGWVLAGGQSAGLLASVDLGFHELGHLVFAVAPGLIPVLAGSVTQVAVPIGLAIYFGNRRESYATALLLAWAATSAANVSAYIADAPYQALPLLGNGTHDWAFILAGKLSMAAPLATGVRYVGVALALLGLAVAVRALVAPGMQRSAVARQKVVKDAREAALRAAAPRRESRTLPPQTARDQAPPAAPAGRC